MNHIKVWISILLVVLITSVITLATARSAVDEGYSLTKYTVEGGVYTWNTSSNYLLGGTLGQHEDGQVAGGDYQIGGGIWPTKIGMNYTYMPVVVR